MGAIVSSGVVSAEIAEAAAACGAFVDIWEEGSVREAAFMFFRSIA
jgi:hypothetical protein